MAKEEISGGHSYGDAFEFERLSERGVLIRFGRMIDHELQSYVLRLDALLQAKPFKGFVESVPTYAALAVYYEPWQVYQAVGRPDQLPFEFVRQHILGLLESLRDAAPETSPRTVVIPVCYGGEYGPELDVVALHCGLTPEEVIRMHGEAIYDVFMLGFLPGFPYMGGLPAALATPRRGTPRLVVPAGSVGIAGAQTGVYPLDSPGGWQLIGRTPLRLFRPEAEAITLLQAGDRVRFAAIDQAEFERLEADMEQD